MIASRVCAVAVHPGSQGFMLSIPTRTAVVLAALSSPVASVSVSGCRRWPRSKKDDKDKKPAEGLTAAQRQEAAPLARLADEVMKGAAPGTYLVTPPRIRRRRTQGRQGHAVAGGARRRPADVAERFPEGPAGPDLRAVHGDASSRARWAPRWPATCASRRRARPACRRRPRARRRRPIRSRTSTSRNCARPAPASRRG